MAYLLNLVNFKDTRGELTVLDNAERLLPFKIKRVFYIYNVDETARGGHRHHETIQAAICITWVQLQACQHSQNHTKTNMTSSHHQDCSPLLNLSKL